MTAMAYTDTHTLESDLEGIAKHAFDVVALAGMDGSAGELALSGGNRYGRVGGAHVPAVRASAGGR